MGRTAGPLWRYCLLLLGLSSCMPPVPFTAPDRHLPAVGLDLGVGRQGHQGDGQDTAFLTRLRVGWDGMTPFWIIGAGALGQYQGTLKAPEADKRANWAVGGYIEAIHIISGFNVRVGPVVALDGQTGFVLHGGWSIFGGEFSLQAGRDMRWQGLFVLRLPVSLAVDALVHP